MAQYKVVGKTYINSSIPEIGDIVEFDGKPNAALELVKAEPAKADKAEKPKKAEGDKA